MPRLPASHRHPYPGLPCPPGTRVLVVPPRGTCYWGLVTAVHTAPQFAHVRYVQGWDAGCHGWQDLPHLYPVADAPTREIGD